MKKTILLLSILLLSGFKLLSSARWDIDKNDPTLWIKFCDDLYELDFDEDDLPSGDELRGQNLTFETVRDSIIDDFNNTATSYLRLAVYPDDPDSPPAPEPGDTAFTRSLAKKRTIDVCIQSSSNPFQGGHAQPFTENGELYDCHIVLAKVVKKDVSDFISTLTHEIGHCVGLTHPQETRHAIMSYYHEPDKIRLQMDDKMGISYLFPHPDYDLEENPTLGFSCSTN